MKIVYCAGRFTAPTREGVEANILAATDIGVAVAALGACPCVPHSNTADPRYEALQPYEWWLDATLELLRKCDAVMLVPGWHDSRGARGEVIEAQRLGIPVFDELAELQSWLEGFTSYDVDDKAIPGPRGHAGSEPVLGEAVVASGEELPIG